jgi:hypothetical protein
MSVSNRLINETTPVEPIRIAVEDYLTKRQLTLGALFPQLGWEGEASHLHKRIKVMLGMIYYNSHGKRKKQQRITIEYAGDIIRAIGRDPWEFGI